VPVVSPVSFGALDALSYNVNADHAATAIAAKLGAIKLVFISNVPGILVAGRVVRAVTARQAEQWIDEGIIFGGMIPKVRSAVEAVRGGVAQAVITNLAGVQDGRRHGRDRKPIGFTTSWSHVTLSDVRLRLTDDG
jgi:acetylglutamate kinase